MQLTLLPDIAGLKDGDAIEYVCGQITKIEPYISARAPSANPTEAKPFKCQRIHINDGTGTAVLKLWDREEMPQTMVGNPLHVYGKPGKVCLKAKLESGRDGKKIYVSVSVEAEVSMNAPQTVSEIAKAPEAKPEVKQETNPAPKPPAPATAESFESASAIQKPTLAKAKHPKTPQPGIRVGMALNLACANLTARNLELQPKAVMEIASDLIRVAQWLEDGNLCPTYTERKTTTNTTNV